MSSVCRRIGFVTANRALLSHVRFNSSKPESIFELKDKFYPHHVGSVGKDVDDMLKVVGSDSMDQFVRSVLPKDVLIERPLKIEPSAGFTEPELIKRLKTIMSKNKVLRSFIGAGYYNTVLPPVIQRNILECPEWYTSYTPYQPEISQGRLESLLNFQTLVSDLTGMDVANSSLLDEGTAAAEAMIMSINATKGKRFRFFVHDSVHPHTIECIQSRASPLGIEVSVGLPGDDVDVKSIAGVLVQYPATDGSLSDWTELGKSVHEKGGLFCVATDLMALTIVKPPSEFGADIVMGTSQRFGVPLGFGGPHAAFFAVTDELKRRMPGRIIGISKDRLGNKAYRLALQTREQHIRREKATSNICTAQALLANISAMYAVYHGPEGLKTIAKRIYSFTSILHAGFSQNGLNVKNGNWFDTLTVEVGNADDILRLAESEYGINFRKIDDSTLGVSIDEATTETDLNDILKVFTSGKSIAATEIAASLSITSESPATIPADFARSGAILDYDVFKSHHTETEMLRYIHLLQTRDLSLANSMIPLGSCTMKLNATTEMLPITWDNVANIHPFVPISQTSGYIELFKELEEDLADITGFDQVSLQPNSGAQGEYTGLRAICAYQQLEGEGHRNICLIPVSAHGTNPASAAMAGLKVVAVKCLANGELDLTDLRTKVEKHKAHLSAIMITYPSTYGVFEPTVREACRLVHEFGGQVYMDGANMNAQIGLTSPGELGADVCHLNLHKTFCIPHGGGGPGMGPIGVKKHLAPFLPGHIHKRVNGIASDKAILPVSAAPWGSASILPISWAYIKLMGGAGLKKATQTALLNANYMLNRLKGHYDVLYTNAEGRCAHEFIIDIRPFKASSGIEAIDVAKRLQDYGFHSPTMSFPVANTLMIEPTESEPKAELDRYCDALIQIREEIREIEKGKVPKDNNVLKNSPHPPQDIASDSWDRPYSRVQAVYPLEYLRSNKFWPPVARLDDVYGDMNLFCTCEAPALEN
ncbi:hypothetical protein CANCADRAFT_675 [Tortispora caseinolytica NRRL Y-17796]|uniref:Glycine cleavage system P protein n=1 Tax=Tortispora caseinolytica NRRL Y-17796 TaxID=767744 RepID=A0A1E4TJZ4_9ASCO|nr:hypothetical protein CANCADRAFT_675 [Tortispora caseinolytica NRRL Y-17796]